MSERLINLLEQIPENVEVRLRKRTTEYGGGVQVTAAKLGSSLCTSYSQVIHWNIVAGPPLDILAHVLDGCLQVVARAED